MKSWAAGNLCTVRQQPSNVQYSDRHQLLRSLLHAGQGVPSKALYGTGCTVRTTRTQGVILRAMNPMTRDLQQSSVH